MAARCFIFLFVGVAFFTMAAGSKYDAAGCGAGEPIETAAKLATLHKITTALQNGGAVSQTDVYARTTFRKKLKKAKKGNLCNSVGKGMCCKVCRDGKKKRFLLYQRALQEEEEQPAEPYHHYIQAW